MLTLAAEAHLNRIIQEFGSGAMACFRAGVPVATLLFILSCTEFLSLYYAGSRRPAGGHGVRAFHQFLSRYFARFNRDIRDNHGHLRRVRIRLLSEGGKAAKRLRLPAALIHLFHRGILEDLVAPVGVNDRCVIMPAGRWGFQICTEVFHTDFQETLRAYAEGVRSDPHLAQQFLRRFHHIHADTPC